MTDVRRATPADAEVLGRLLWDFNTEFDSPTDPASVLSPRLSRLLERRDVVGLLAGERDGFALLTLRPAIWFDGPVSQLEELYVVPDLRSQGIGSALLARARNEVRELGSPEIHIGVDEVDVDARRFYERHGFRTIEEGVDYRMLYYLGPTAG